MEGKSLPAIIVLLLCAGSVSFAQTSRSGHYDPAAFLEPNRFSVAKDLDNRALWLSAGYGHVVLSLDDRAAGLGMEGLIWSRLRALSGFRFPVETADYFFGLYIAVGGAGDPERLPDWRFRISHISSHIVDGADSTIVGGSSSRFSREFIELSKRWEFNEDLVASVGLRWLFHQVQSIEPAFALPATFSWRFYDSWKEPIYERPLGRGDRIELSVFGTTAYGPSWPTYGAGLVATISNDWLQPTDLKVYHVWGAPWDGVEAAKRNGAVRAELCVHAF